MVGGTIIGITRTDERTHVNVASCPHNRKHGRGDQCPQPDTRCVYTDEVRISDGVKIEINIGDSLWWQCGKCYWTPKANFGNEEASMKCGVDYDIELKKIGYSH